MMKLRNTVMAVALGMGVMGCSFAHWSIYHCSECDDFPMPAQASNNPMMPGTYTGPPPKDMTGSSPPATTAPASAPGSAPTMPADPFSSSPPAVPTAPPGS
jgi:hypothetical protein